MCTSIATSGPRPLFGRTLDLAYPFGQQVVVTPRNHPLHFHNGQTVKRHYAMVGMAAAAEGTALYAEAMNEKGLYMAGLNFPHSAHYFKEPDPGRLNTAPWEMIFRVLAGCDNVAQARALLGQVCLVNVPFSAKMPNAPLHWHLADAEGNSLVAEPVAEGLRLYDAPAGVLTNEPPYPVQMANLTGYMGLSAAQPENRMAPGVPLAPYGEGMGALGLPGDWSPMSRFVRAAYLRANSAPPDSASGAVIQFFRILEAVSMPRGAVLTQEGQWDMTGYACCLDPCSGVYYYTTYLDHRITAVRLGDVPLEGTLPTTYPLAEQPDILWRTPPAGQAEKKPGESCTGAGTI